jgi:tetratricopeptide (TPR) repeat protein
MGLNKNVFKKLFPVLFLVLMTIGLGAQDSDEKLELLILTFKIDTTESLQNTPLDLNSPLASALSKRKEINLLNEENYTNIDLYALQKGIPPEGIDGVDLIVFGEYIVESGYVKIKPVIYDMNEQLFDPLSSSRGRIDGLDVLMDAVADNLIDKFIEISPVMRQSVKQIAIVPDFEPLSGIYKNIGPIKLLAENYTKQIIQEVEYQGNADAEIIPWNKVFDYIDLPPSEVINKLKPDMYLRLKFIFDDQKVIAVKPDFFIVEENTGRGVQKREFDLPMLKADHYKVFDFQDFVVNELSDFLDRIINESGQWDFIAFPTKSSTAPTNADALIYKAENLAAKDDFYLSNYQYYAVINNFSENVDLADIHLKLGFNKVYLYRLEEAEEEFDFVLSEDPGNGYAYLGKSLINYYNGDYAEAKNLLEEANTHNIDNKFLTETLKGYYNFELENYSEAKSNFESALAEKQGIIKIRIVNNLSISAIKIHIGLCYLGLNEFTKSIEYYKALQKEFPYNEDIPYYLGNAYSKKGIEEFFKGNYNEAILNFTESRKTYPNSNINDYLRLSLINVGDFDQATKFIEEEIASGNYFPEYIWEINALDIKTIMLDQAMLANLASFNPLLGAEAIKSLDRSIQFNSNNPHAFYQIGDIYTLMGMLDSGFVYLEKAFKLDPYNFDIQLGLMQANLLLNDYRSTEKMYKSLSRINRKLVVDERTEALIDFMYISASLAQDQKAKKEMKNLDRILDQAIIFNQWIPNPYQEWLNHCQCTDEAKKVLEGYLSKIKEHSLN